MNNTISFFLGIVASLTSTVLLYYFRYAFGYLINLLFFKVYPKVEGEYTVYQYKYEKSKDNQNLNDEIIADDRKKLKPHARNQEIIEFLKQKERKSYLKLKISQFAYKITGEIYVLHQGEIKVKEKLVGRVTPSRVMILNSETKDKDHHNFGTYLLNITPDSNIIRGTRNVLCINCGNAIAVYIILEKNK
jgi:asparagine synthetase B (glutamine-hydrolysing)